MPPTTTRTRGQELLCAYHEAGHAVVALALGGRLVEASVEPTPALDSWGHVRVVMPTAFARVAVNEAGAIAEGFAGVTPAGGWDTGRGDDELTRRAGVTPAARIAAFTAARQILYANDAAVHFLAHRLVELRTMSGAAVAAFLRECRLTVTNPTRH